MRAYVLAAAMLSTIAAGPAFADEVVRVDSTVRPGVTVGIAPEVREESRTTVIKEREPAERTTVIKKEDEFGNRSKTVIHHDDD